MNRLALVAIGLFLLALTACAPQAQVEDNVIPTLVSATVEGDTVVLQGRYFGDGQGGQANGSYVILGANANGNGGVRAPVVSWAPSRIEVSIPEGTGYGYAFVYVDRIRSTGLPVNIF
ncbi:MAG TPA: hypothetical protein VF168_03430 [Trueperaceae bacterium]